MCIESFTEIVVKVKEKSESIDNAIFRSEDP